ncbi:MAG: cation diffusion facilitator family transporter [Asgard group archaeon]|nr:cation diffusion facilitator family transporter [Asgard group archaeon]
MDNNLQEKKKKVKQVTIAGIVLNLVLAIIKILISVFYGSTAVLADGLDSALDILMTILGFAAIKIADKPPDKEHQYGHGKMEYLFSLGIAILLVISSGIITYQAINKLILKITIEFSYANIGISIASIIIKGILVFINLRIGQKINSPTLIANGKNFRTDIFTSTSVLLSVIITPIKINNFSFFWFDPIIAMIISILIIYTAFTIFQESASILLDRSPDPQIIDKISKIAKNVQGVYDIRGIRARTIGPKEILADLDIFVDPHLTVSEGHKIVCKVEEAIKEKMPVQYLQIHIEPYEENK